MVHFKDLLIFFCVEFVIDAHVCGNDARFINHSCEPNCELQKWFVNGLPVMAIFSTEDIQAGAEITYNYKFEPFGRSMDCHCGSKKCKGTIGEGTNEVVKSNVEKIKRPKYILPKSKNTHQSTQPVSFDLSFIIIR